MPPYPFCILSNAHSLVTVFDRPDRGWIEDSWRLSGGEGDDSGERRAGCDAGLGALLLPAPSHYHEQRENDSQPPKQRGPKPGSPPQQGRTLRRLHRWRRGRGPHTDDIFGQGPISLSFVAAAGRVTPAQAKTALLSMWQMDRRCQDAVVIVARHQYGRSLAPAPQIWADLRAANRLRHRGLVARAAAWRRSCT